jgi:hypothetical protein
MTGPTYLSIFKTGRWVSYEHALKFTISECLQDIEQSLLLCSIVFRPAWWPARFKTRVPGFDRFIELVGSIFFLYKSKRRRFSEKKVNGLQPDFWPCFSLSNFFFNPARFQPRICQVNPPGRTGFQNYAMYSR